MALKMKKKRRKRSPSPSSCPSEAPRHEFTACTAFAKAAVGSLGFAKSLQRPPKSPGGLQRVCKVHRSRREVCKEFAKFTEAAGRFAKSVQTSIGDARLTDEGPRVAATAAGREKPTEVKFAGAAGRFAQSE
jgi:hypothetical protein